MSHEHSSTVIVGFTMDQDEFLMPFKVTTKEKFHMEERFSPKTGKKLEPLKVVDEESIEAYEVEGETYECAYDAVDALGTAVGCSISGHGNSCTGEDWMVGIEPNAVSGGGPYDNGIPLTEIPKLMEECQRIKAVFAKKYGIHLGEPVITSLDSYG